MVILPLNGTNDTVLLSRLLYQDAHQPAPERLGGQSLEIQLPIDRFSSAVVFLAFQRDVIGSSSGMYPICHAVDVVLGHFPPPFVVFCWQ